MNHRPERRTAERAARERTERFRSELGDAAGGMYDEAEVADLLGVSATAVVRMHGRRELLGVSDGPKVRFPAAQFRQRHVVAGLTPILEAFGDMNPWGQLQLLLVPLDGFDDEPISILDLLANGADEPTRTELVQLVEGWSG